MKIILVIGPTASGKSDYAQEMALEAGGEIVNFDSQQCYLGLDIGTGKVPPAERKVPHWLLDILEPGEFMSAGAFARLAEGKIAGIHQRKKIPILVGGTGLYARALLEGLDQLPERDPGIREALQKRIAEEGKEALHGQLKAVDPALAHQVAPQDSARLIRFLEIFKITGRKPSDLMQTGSARRLRFETETHWFRPPREALRALIRSRVHGMVQGGWMAEVKRLIKEGRHPRDWSNKPIGYEEISRVLEEGTDPGEAEAEIVRKTVAYAKRQETFFKKLLSNPAYGCEGSTIKILENFFRKS